jgi:maltose alpha-D-glucosyltransferase / alpha-amylase
MIRTRRECPEIGWGDYTIVPTSVDSVLALRYDWRSASLVVLHNVSAERQEAEVQVRDAEQRPLVNVLEDQTIKSHADGRYYVDLEPYGYRWLRVGAVDAALDRSEF